MLNNFGGFSISDPEIDLPLGFIHPAIALHTKSSFFFV